MLKFRRAHCHRCGCDRHFRKRDPAHLTHLAATVFTFGLWGIGWAVCALQHIRKPWRCAFCCERMQKSPSLSPVKTERVSGGLSARLS